MEILSRINRNLTTSSLLGERKEWIATAAMLAASVASSIFGGASARRKAKAAKAEQDYRAAKEKAWYDKEYNTDYIDTKAGQNLMRRAQEVQDNYIRKADGAAAVGGSTAASVAQAKEAANRTMGDTIANIGAQDTARKQHVADQHNENLKEISKERQATEQAKAQATSDAAQNMSNAFMSAAVNQMGSQLDGGKGLSKSNLDASSTASDNINVTQPSVSSGNGAPSLEEAVGKSKQKVQWI